MCLPRVVYLQHQQKLSPMSDVCTFLHRVPPENDLSQSQMYECFQKPNKIVLVFQCGFPGTDHPRLAKPVKWSYK